MFSRLNCAVSIFVYIGLFFIFIVVVSARFLKSTEAVVRVLWWVIKLSSILVL